LPGNSIGPGRPPGYRSALAKTLDEIPEKDAKAIRDKMVKLAKVGDMAAARLVLDRYWRNAASCWRPFKSIPPLGRMIVTRP